MGLIIKNNVIYNGAESEPIIYSEEEREVGCWIDGRPLYQKTYHDSYTNPGSGSHSTNHDLPGIITQVIPGYIRYEYQGGVYYLIGSQMNSYLQVTIPETSSPTYFIATQTVGGVTQTDIYYTVQYIKETDQPGSGTWTPSGVKAVHYSENEQVVGTWTDGSTLYEQTFNHDISGDQEHWYVYLDTLIDGINDWTIINWEGFIQFQEDGIKYAGVLPGNVGTVYLHRDSNRWRLYFHQGNAYCTWGIISITIRYIKKMLGQPVS